MFYTLALLPDSHSEQLMRGLPLEFFLYGPKRCHAVSEVFSILPDCSQENTYARLDWVHIHAARDHLVLTDPKLLDIQDHESTALLSSVQDILSEIGPCVFQDSHHALIETPALRTLDTVTIAQAQDRNIDFWMPQDTSEPGVARLWRRWQNEIQMIWFNHPVNLKRQSEGLLPINSVWISGIGQYSDLKPHPCLLRAQTLHDPHRPFDELLLPPINQRPLVKDVLLSPTELAQSISLLNPAEADTEKQWQIACQALQDGLIESIQIIDLSQQDLPEKMIQWSDLPQRKSWAFWQKKNLSLHDVIDGGEA